MTSNEPEALTTHESGIHTILLVVEDDEDISEFIAQVLQDETPHAVLAAPTASCSKIEPCYLSKARDSHNRETSQAHLER